jgi:hypothetical protein
MVITKEIPGFPGYYVSDSGNVYSSNTGNNRICKKLKPGDDHRGYMHVILTKKGNKYNKKVHHLVLETFVGKKPSHRHIARHLNDDGYDNRLCNLKWGTMKENIQDCRNTGWLSKNYRVNRRGIDSRRKKLINELFKKHKYSLEDIQSLTRCPEQQIKTILKII